MTSRAGWRGCDNGGVEAGPRVEEGGRREGVEETRTTANLSTKRSAQMDAAVFDAIQETTKIRFSTRDGQQVGDKDVRQWGSGKAEEASASAEAPALYREGRLNGTRTRRGGRAGLAGWRWRWRWRNERGSGGSWLNQDRRAGANGPVAPVEIGIQGIHDSSPRGPVRLQWRPCPGSAQAQPGTGREEGGEPPPAPAPAQPPVVVASPGGHETIEAPGITPQVPVPIITKPARPAVRASEWPPPPPPTKKAQARNEPRPGQTCAAAAAAAACLCSLQEGARMDRTFARMPGAHDGMNQQPTAASMQELYLQGSGGGAGVCCMCEVPVEVRVSGRKGTRCRHVLPSRPGQREVCPRADCALVMLVLVLGARHGVALRCVALRRAALEQSRAGPFRVLNSPGHLSSVIQHQALLYSGHKDPPPEARELRKRVAVTSWRPPGARWNVLGSSSSVAPAPGRDSPQPHDETVRPHLPTEAADEVLADGRVYGYLGLIIIYRSAVRQSKRVTRRILLGNAPPHWRSSPTIQAWQAMGAPPGHCVRSSTRRQLDVAVRLPRRQPLRRGGQARQALKISCRGTPPTRAAAAPRETKSLRISSHRRARGEGGGGCWQHT
ncbi:hypothetical protein Purlil1_5926 [Purpureocillium lilacinum]|uniref:Uncharacterized protein n=1 Tax=Purpureocillium lilacinum TaxID=33203 RepID=A0ABR0C290_PURLI|nr:hypothetical protein Purlil1_5926 [Purpureocillium lilacinum]